MFARASEGLARQACGGAAGMQAQIRQVPLQS